MLIREHIRRLYPCILESADLTAHHERDQGLVFDAIKMAVENGYKTSDGKRVIDYKGIDETTWRSEWNQLLTELNISVNKRLLGEITICICSAGTIIRNAGMLELCIWDFQKIKLPLLLQKEKETRCM